MYDPDESYTDRKLRQIETDLRIGVGIGGYLVFHILLAYLATFAFHLGELWDGHLRGTTTPPYIGWTSGVLAFIALSVWWYQKVFGGGWR